MNTLFDGIINEGLSTYFEISFAKTNPKKTFFAKTIIDRTDEENEKILLNLRDELDAKSLIIILDSLTETISLGGGYAFGIFFLAMVWIFAWLLFSKKYLEKPTRKSKIPLPTNTQTSDHIIDIKSTNLDSCF